MTAEQFRRAALALPDAAEGAHQGHADFRVAGRIFATLGYPDAGFGVVMLTPDEQRFFVREFGDAFEPVRGAWGRNGSTQVRLRAARLPQVRTALEYAWSRRAPKSLRGVK